MIIFTEHDSELIMPEINDYKYLEDTAGKLEKLKNRKKIKQLFKSAYLKYRNISGLKINKIEYDIINDILKQNVSIKRKLILICGAGTVYGAVFNDVEIEKAISMKEVLESKIHFCTSNPLKNFNTETVQKYKSQNAEI